MLARTKPESTPDGPRLSAFSAEPEKAHGASSRIRP